MEQHPVPQNVTTFQFRLVGDMTLKQFGYLAGGLIMGYLSYKLPLPFFFTWPLAITFALGGFGFAFVPIEERPMDVWVLSFLKSIYSPTLYVWSREVKVQQAPHAPQASMSIKAPHVPAQRVVRSDKSISDILLGLFSSSGRSGQTGVVASQPLHNIPPAQNKTGRVDVTPPPIVDRDRAAPADRLGDAKRRELVLETQMSAIKTKLEHKTLTDARVLELQRQLSALLKEKEALEHELAELRLRLAPHPVSTTPAVPKPSPVATPSLSSRPVSGPTVKIITPERAVGVGIPRLTTFPNVITGVIKDSDNNFLPGVLVTVKDKEGVPVRALKTNRLGQFASSTPLANGVYFVEIEDPRGRYIFDRVQITLNGSIVPAIEIIAKSQKEINRAKLAREIFGTPI